jgi:hypothetical protein
MAEDPVAEVRDADGHGERVCRVLSR